MVKKLFVQERCKGNRNLYLFFTFMQKEMDDIIFNLLLYPMHSDYFFVNLSLQDSYVCNTAPKVYYICTDNYSEVNFTSHFIPP